MGRLKVTVVGAGNVGGSIAQRLAEKNWFDIVLVMWSRDSRKEKP